MMRTTAYAALLAIVAAPGALRADVTDAKRLVAHKPINVQTDETLEALAKTPGSGVTGGPGQDATHPFVIENLRIKHDTEPGIRIEHTTSHVVVRNVLTEGVVRRGRTSRGQGLSLVHAENVTVEDSRFDKGRGVGARMCYKITLRRVDLGMGTFVLYDTNRCTLTECRTTDCLAQGFMVWHSKHNRFERCEARRMAREGIAFNGSAHDNAVIDCTFERCVWAGISVECSNRIVMRGNRVSHSRGYGIVLAYRSDGLVAENNTVTESGQDGIQVQACRGTRLAGNTVRYSGATGIWFLKSSDCTADKNTVSHTHTGLSVSGESSGNVLSANDVSLCMYGVKIEGDGNTLGKNRVHQNRNAVVIDASKCTVEANEITDHINGIGVAGDHNTVRANRFDWVGMCINVGGSHNRIVANQLKRFPYGGITLRKGSTQNRVENNVCEAGVYPAGISVAGGTKNRIVNNRIVETTGGIELKQKANDNVVEGNQVTGADVGLSVVDSTGNQLVQNVLNGCKTPMRIYPKWRKANRVEKNVVK